jgi:16S rRNA A1518/A1519 N6-dimethyltransferase RsmA/KsgA/DIM1 with predicted DNA glycosylase/AP lyase activity
VVHADAASVPLPGRPFRVVANPPYGISSSLLRTLLAPGSRRVAADLGLERAVVRKYASGPARRFSLTAGIALPRRARSCRRRTWTPRCSSSAAADERGRQRAPITQPGTNC